MRRLRIHGTDLNVACLSLGTAGLHRIISGRARARLIQESVALGITHFDTAPYYGFGLAEQWLGVALGEGHRDVTIATKIGLYPPGGRSASAASVVARKAAGRIFPSLTRPLMDWTLARADASLSDSLRFLRRDHLDLLLLHEPAIPSTVADELAEWMEQQRRAGRIRHWGVAGEKSACEPFVVARHPVAVVVQTRDSLNRREAQFVAEAGRPLQFTFGYLAAGMADRSGQSPTEVMGQALRINRTGSVLVSTRGVEHLRALARVAEEDGPA